MNIKSFDEIVNYRLKKNLLVELLEFIKENGPSNLYSTYGFGTNIYNYLFNLYYYYSNNKNMRSSNLIAESVVYRLGGEMEHVKCPSEFKIFLEKYINKAKGRIIENSLKNIKIE